MAKKKKAKSVKKVVKKTPKITTKKKLESSVAKRKSNKKVVAKAGVMSKSAKKATSSKVAPKKISKKVSKVKALKVKPQLKKETISMTDAVKPVEKTVKVKKKRITKAETLRLMQQEKLILKWQSLHKKLDKIKTNKYNMRQEFEEETGISHKSLGWGFILSNVNDRLEVLFKDGIKNLISNYKS